MPDGGNHAWWTRSPEPSFSSAWCVDVSDYSAKSVHCGTYERGYGYRPIFTIPYNINVDPYYNYDRKYK